MNNNTLFIRHRMPDIQFYTGKWTIEDRGVLLYLLTENKYEIFYLQPTDKVVKYIEKNIITNRKYIGEYSVEKKSIIYKINIDEHNLVLDSALKIDNFIRIRLIEESNIFPINILKI